MKDIQGIEVKIGDRVAYKDTSELKTGTVIRIRKATRYNKEYEVARIRLEEPIRRFERGRYVRNVDAEGWTFIQGEERTSLTEREVFGSKNLIVIPVKPDLTNE